MSSSTTEDRLIESPRRTESIDIQSDSQMLKKKYNTSFLGIQASQKVTVLRKYIDTKTHGVQLYYQEYTPQFVDAQVIIVHGFGEHSGNYKQLTDNFLSNNFKVILYDQRGFGYSGGIRGQATVEQMHMDLDNVLQQIDRSIPLFIFCHALGAAMVISFCLMNPNFLFQGLICSSAQLRVPAKYGKLKMLILRLMTKLCPDLQVNTYQNLSYASKNNHHIKRLATDSLMYPFMSIQFAYNVLLFQQFILPNAQKFKIPILLIHGKLDKVASHLDSLDFYRLIQSKEKTLKIFESGYHELHNDSEWSKMKILITQWCTKMLTKDIKITFMREHNYGVIVKEQRNKIRLIIVLLLILLKNKYTCLKLSTKFSVIIFIELMLRVFIPN